MMYCLSLSLVIQARLPTRAKRMTASEICIILCIQHSYCSIMFFLVSWKSFYFYSTLHNLCVIVKCKVLLRRTQIPSHSVVVQCLTTPLSVIMFLL